MDRDCGPGHECFLEMCPQCPRYRLWSRCPADGVRIEIQPRLATLPSVGNSVRLGKEGSAQVGLRNPLAIPIYEIVPRANLRNASSGMECTSCAAVAQDKLGIWRTSTVLKQRPCSANEVQGKIEFAGARHCTSIRNVIAQTQTQINS